MRPLLLVLLVLFSLAACGESDGVLRTSPDLAPGSRVEGCVVIDDAAPVKHRVRRGETLSSIAQTFYGDAALWREIALENPDLVGGDGSVDAGVELIIPFDSR